jgi:hypothetical protein
MLNRIIIFTAILSMALGCSPTEDYTLGDLNPPSNIVINAEIVGKTPATPDGDGSGDVKFTITATDALNYRIDYDAADGISLDNLPTGKATRKYTKLGTNTYVVTVVAYGKGGSSSTATQEVTVQSSFSPDASIIDNLTGGGSKTWVVDQSVAGHLGVGPWSDGSSGPEWWAASIDEKVACCNCFYTATFKFNKIPGGYSLEVNTPDGAFTKTGSLAGGLPGIPTVATRVATLMAAVRAASILYRPLRRFRLLPRPPKRPFCCRAPVRLSAMAPCRRSLKSWF